MKAFRSVLSPLSFGLSATFLSFLVSCVLTGGQQRNDGDDSGALAFKPLVSGAHSEFTRQAVDGEMEDSGPGERGTSHDVSILAVILQSETLSLFVQVQSRQPALSQPGCGRTILFGQLII